MWPSETRYCSVRGPLVNRGGRAIVRSNRGSGNTRLAPRARTEESRAASGPHQRRAWLRQLSEWKAVCGLRLGGTDDQIGQSWRFAASIGVKHDVVGQQCNEPVQVALARSLLKPCEQVIVFGQKRLEPRPSRADPSFWPAAVSAGNWIRSGPVRRQSRSIHDRRLRGGGTRRVLQD
jgi:hypothetical protein